MLRLVCQPVNDILHEPGVWMGSGGGGPQGTVDQETARLGQQGIKGPDYILFRNVMLTFLEKYCEGGADQVPCCYLQFLLLVLLVPLCLYASMRCFMNNCQTVVGAEVCTS